jgi:hypothetical protein
MSWVTVVVYPVSQGMQDVWDGGFWLGNITYATWDAEGLTGSLRTALIEETTHRMLCF